MRVSEHFALGVDQGALDFVDVDVANDVPVFIDPRAIRVQPGEWARECEQYLVSYFSELLAAIHNRDTARISELISSLGSEPNETHLGVSRGRSQGRGIGPKKRAELVQSLAGSKAALSGLLEDLEDTALFIPGIGRDFVSDMATSVIRAPLVSYTQKMCELHDIDMKLQWSGPTWDADSLEWTDSDVLLPRGPHGKLLLVPRSIVRAELSMTADEYYNDYLREYLVADEIEAMSSLVTVLKKSGAKKVRYKDIASKYGNDKPSHAANTLTHPDALAEYRASMTLERIPPLDPSTLSAAVGSPEVDYDELLAAVKSIAPGPGGATPYHRAVTSLLSAIFGPYLGSARPELQIHEGRKRLDIAFDNTADLGFFRFLSLNFPASTIVVECKNYSDDIANPELDQIQGRFSQNRGRVGLIVCRGFDNKELFLQRCRDTAQDGNGFIILLDDEDLSELVDWAKGADALTRLERGAFPLLRDRFDLLRAQQGTAQ